MAADSIHPVLKDLGLSDKASGEASALSVLNHLLQTNVLNQEQVQTAAQTIHDSASSSSNSKKKKQSKPAAPQPPAATPRTRHIALRFFYDGADYTGLAQNLGMETDQSVEKALFQALLKARLIESRETSGYSRCGRTDKGVSAAGQVIALNLKSAIPPDASWDEQGQQLATDEELPNNDFDKLSLWVTPRNKKGKQVQRVQRSVSEYPYAKMLNNMLPKDIRILGWAPVSTEFSARFSANRRTYRYFFLQQQMDLDRMRAGLELLVGKHDFRNFCKMDVEKVYNFERVIHRAQLIETGKSDRFQTCYVQIDGQAFLWHQIRCIMEILFMIGRGSEETSIITSLLDVEKYPGKPSYTLAPERPLVLHDCGYPNLQVGYSVQNVWTVTCQMEQEWEELTLAAARLRNGIDAFDNVQVRRDELVQFATSKLADRAKKLQKYGGSVDDGQIRTPLPPGDNPMILWKDALEWLAQNTLIPDSNGLSTTVHVPLLERSMGTTYEEKVEALKKSDKRRQKFEENIIKKRKTAEEDAAFYEHMNKQGGSGL
eukprot:Nitzschia sp. Nitz4//scaffold57_size113557//79970//81601//NITZ4_004002-RA/size113557-processed-gene-0.15-mRNA-1//1//CDS//3329554879//8530//frame0